MKLLLDTHAFVWFVTDDPRLSSNARAAIEDAQNQVALSIASVWEMAIKHRLGKLSYPAPFDQFILQETAKNDISLLPITVQHAIAVAFLPLHHRDPFDRLLAVQSKAENMTLVSIDAAMDHYDLRRLW